MAGENDGGVSAGGLENMTERAEYVATHTPGVSADMARQAIAINAQAALQRAAEAANKVVQSHQQGK